LTHDPTSRTWRKEGKGNNFRYFKGSKSCFLLREQLEGWKVSLNATVFKRELQRQTMSAAMGLEEAAMAAAMEDGVLAMEGSSSGAMAAQRSQKGKLTTRHGRWATD